MAAVAEAKEAAAREAAAMEVAAVKEGVVGAMGVAWAMEAEGMAGSAGVMVARCREASE